MDIKQSTASQEILLGPFLDDDDGITQKTGLTIANTDIKLFKAGATTFANKNSGGATEIATGFYYCVLDATDTDTLGLLVVVVQIADCLCVRHEFNVVSANYYDHKYGSGNVNSDVIGISGDTTAADNLEDVFDDATSVANIKAMFDGSGYAGGTVKLDTNVSTIANGAITAAAIATGAIDADAIADNAIDAGAIATGAITNAKFAAGAIDATVIANAAIDFATFAADCKTGTGLKANVESISANAITATAINADAITADKIADNAFANEHFADGALTSTEITSAGGCVVASIANNAITAAAIATDAIDADALNADALAEIADAVWDEAIAGHAEVGSTGAALTAAGSAGDPWATAIPGAYGAGTAGLLLGTTIPAAIDAIDNYVDTEIGALTTELAKVPKSDSNVSWNATALAAIQGECTDALNAYDPPTNAEFELRTLPAADYTVVSDLGTVQTGDAFARLGAPAGASVSADIAAVKAETATIVADTNEIQAELADGGRTDLLIDAILADTNELQVDDTPTAVAAVKTVVDAVKVQTDKLTFTVANQVDANTQYINDVAITGDGSATPFNVV